MTRDNMAYVYAGLIPIKNYPFKQLNKVIISKWSKSGLIYIKTKAWKVVRELHDMELAYIRLIPPQGRGE